MELGGIQHQANGDAGRFRRRRVRSVGAVAWRTPSGAVLGLRVVTAEPSPRTLELRGRDVFPVVHAYGTNGVVTEVEVPLAEAQPWWDGVYAFPRSGTRRSSRWSSGRRRRSSRGR